MSAPTVVVLTDGFRAISDVQGNYIRIMVMKSSGYVVGIAKFEYYGETQIGINLIRKGDNYLVEKI